MSSDRFCEADCWCFAGRFSPNPSLCVSFPFTMLSFGTGCFVGASFFLMLKGETDFSDFLACYYYCCCYYCC